MKLCIASTTAAFLAPLAAEPKFLILLAAALAAALALAWALALSCSSFLREIVEVGALAVDDLVEARLLPEEPAEAPPFFFWEEPVGAPPACGEPVGVVGVAPVVKPLDGDVEESEPHPAAAKARQPTAAKIASNLRIAGIIAIATR
jgi:hypothetical protein